MKKKTVLVLGASGMLGNTLLRTLFLKDNLIVHSTTRNLNGLAKFFPTQIIESIKTSIDVFNYDSLLRVLEELRPDIAINCIGIIKQLPEVKDPIASIKINSLFPHQLAGACKAVGAKLIHFSTDCVFSGKKGNYSEDNFADADDLYGRTKFLGELHYPHCTTLRTSIIGHELKSKHGLIEWFLNETGSIKGFTRAIFSGFPTVEIAHIIADYVIPNDKLSGIYHVSSEPISKYDLLKLVADKYGHKIKIEPYDDFICDRSLNSAKFRSATGYFPPSWEDLVNRMHDDYIFSKRR